MLASNHDNIFVSNPTKYKLENTYAEFRLLRLLYGFNFFTRDNIVNNKYRAEIFDLSISLEDDFYSKSFYSNIDQFLNNSDFEFSTYSLTYLIKELIYIIFGIEGDNIFLNVYKFTKRLEKLFVLINIKLILKTENKDLDNFLNTLHFFK